MNYRFIIFTLAILLILFGIAGIAVDSQNLSKFGWLITFGGLRGIRAIGFIGFLVGLIAILFASFDLKVADTSNKLFYLALIFVAALIVSMFMPLIWRLSFPDDSIPYGITNFSNSAELIVGMLALAFSAGSLGIYKVVREEISAQVRKESRLERARAIVINSLNLSHGYALIYSERRPWPPWPEDYEPRKEYLPFLLEAMGNIYQVFEGYVGRLDPEDYDDRRRVLKLKLDLIRYVIELSSRWGDCLIKDQLNEIEKRLTRVRSYVAEIRERETELTISYPDEIDRWKEIIEFAERFLKADDTNLQEKTYSRQITKL